MSTTRLTGDHGYTAQNLELADDTVVDMRGAIFRTQQKPAKKNLYPIVVRSGRRVRLTGGIVIGDTPLEIGWGERYSGANSAAITFGHWKQANDLMAGGIVDRVRLYNIWDGIRPTCAKEFLVSDIWVEHGADDLFENDGHVPGTFENSLLDRVFVAFSSQNATSEKDGSREVMSIRNNLIRMGLFPGWPGKRQGSGPASGAVFKWERQGTRIRFTDNVLCMVDSPRTQFGTRFDPLDNLGYGATWGDVCIECRNNLIIWLGDGPYPWPVPAGFEVVTDPDEWLDRKMAWIAAHPEIDRLPHDPPAITLPPTPPPVEPKDQELAMLIGDIRLIADRLEELVL